MIHLKTAGELQKMREAGRIVALAHECVHCNIRPGMTTKQLNALCEDVIVKAGAIPSFKGLYGFPAATCISVNSLLVHGIPDDTILKEGDIVSVDIGACYQGYHGDSAWTYAVGVIDEADQRLMQISEASLFEGLKYAKAGNRLTDISHAIGEFVFAHGYSIPRDYTGHGVGKNIHEDPAVPNFGPAGYGVILKPGMTIAVEPMVLAGRPQTRVLKDGWGVITKDGAKAAHYEHTIAITNNGYEILTTLIKEEHPENG
ncbi:type I methionyl aminopeptidase [Merdibacter massiliensis]|uniref:type I methionyl aminopeptidase n=1 Tax=Merdibacter massiliensis TaxID=1871030 RepID=UPI00096AB8B8|nr:type I methionyl aminopeptidase [Merdibacter massiliensis]